MFTSVRDEPIVREGKTVVKILFEASNPATPLALLMLDLSTLSFKALIHIVLSGLSKSLVLLTFDKDKSAFVKEPLFAASFRRETKRLSVTGIFLYI